MPLYDETDEPFVDIEAQFVWVPNVLAIEYGELEVPEPIPAALNWPALIPEDPRYDFETLECSLAYENPKTGYVATVWDASGADDLPWAVLLADDFGVRLLAEYSVMDETAGEAALETALARAAAELPERLEAGEFDRTGEPVAVPDWLLVDTSEVEEY